MTARGADARTDEFERFHEFAEQRLVPDLERAQIRRDAVDKARREFDELLISMELLRTRPVVSLDAQIDLGCSFYAQARVPDTSRIFVDVGLGFHAEFTLDEALVYVRKRVHTLTDELAAENASLNQIRAHLNLIYSRGLTIATSAPSSVS